MKLSWVHSTSRPVEPSRLESPEPPELSRCQGITIGECVSGLIPLVSSSLSLMSVLSGSLSVSVLYSPAEVNLRTIWRRQLLHIITPCRQPDLAARSTVINGLTFGDSGLTLFKGVGPRMGSLESSSWVWGILVHPSLLAGPISSQPPL